MWKACSGSKPIERKANTGTPWNQDGISTSINPAIQGPIGWRPLQIAALRKEIMLHLNAGQTPAERAAYLGAQIAFNSGAQSRTTNDAPVWTSAPRRDMNGTCR